MATRRLICCTGAKGSGKDTVYKTLNDKLDFPVKRFAFADALKRELSINLRLDMAIMNAGQESKDNTKTRYKWNHAMFAPYADGRSGFMSYREVMQVYGTEIVRRSRGEHYWVDQLMDSVHAWLDTDSDNIAVITDCRFDNEVERVYADGGTVVTLTGGSTADMHSSESVPKVYDHKIRGRGKGSLKQMTNDLSKVLWTELGVKL